MIYAALAVEEPSKTGHSATHGTDAIRKNGTNYLARRWIKP